MRLKDKLDFKIVLGGVGVSVVLVAIIVSRSGSEEYEVTTQIPHYEQNSKPKDGDTQADTIKALQAYAKEAVSQAKQLNERTSRQATNVLENTNNVSKLQKDTEAIKKEAEKISAATQNLVSEVKILKNEISEIRKTQESSKSKLDEHGIPVGFGFDHLREKRNAEVGTWHDPIDKKILTEQGDASVGYAGLLSPPGTRKNSVVSPQAQPQKNAGPVIEPALTIPKDAILFDGIALTALVGRIPVEGVTPDPYPVKIIVGKEALLANGHELPEVEGMYFSGWGVGDMNLSCVRVNLNSATFIFEDGSIVNHSTKDGKLGYVSDQVGVPCISGKFKTNAVKFVTQRVALGGIGAAGSAYAEAQFDRSKSDLTGVETKSLTGSIEKLVAGTVVQEGTQEANQWLLERQKQSFDAVVVMPGADISVHLEQALSIDRRSDNRKVTYKALSDNQYRSLD